MQYRTLYGEIWRYNVETRNIRNIVTSPGQYVSAQKPATLAGGYYPPLRTLRNIRSVIRWHRLRRASLPSWAARFHCYFLLYIEDNPPAKSCCGLRRIFAGGSGADITKNLFPKKEVLVGDSRLHPNKTHIQFRPGSRFPHDPGNCM